MDRSRNNKGVLVAVVWMVIGCSLLIRALRSGASNREGSDCPQDPVHRNWRSLSLPVVTGVLLALAFILQYVGESTGIAFLRMGLAVAAVCVALRYLFHPKEGWSGSGKFFSLVAVNVILLVLSGFFVSQNNQAMGFVSMGLFGVVFAYSIWPIFNPCSDRSGLILEIFKTAVVLLALLGIAFTLQGLGSLRGLDALDSIGRELSELFGGS